MVDILIHVNTGVTKSNRWFLYSKNPLHEIIFALEEIKEALPLLESVPSPGAYRPRYYTFHLTTWTLEIKGGRKWKLFYDFKHNCIIHRYFDYKHVVKVINNILKLLYNNEFEFENGYYLLPKEYLNTDKALLFL